MARILIYLGFVLTLGAASGGWDLAAEIGNTDAAVVMLELDHSSPVFDLWAMLAPFLTLPVLLLALLFIVPLPAPVRSSVFSVAEFQQLRAPPASPV